MDILSIFLSRFPVDERVCCVSAGVVMQFSALLQRMWSDGQTIKARNRKDKRMQLRKNRSYVEVQGHLVHLYEHVHTAIDSSASHTLLQREGHS